MQWIGIAVFKDTRAFLGTVLCFLRQFKNSITGEKMGSRFCLFNVMDGKNQLDSSALGIQGEPAASPGQSVESRTPIPQMSANFVFYGSLESKRNNLVVLLFTQR